MPSPILHSFAGYSLYKTSLSRDEAPNWKIAGFLMVVANLPDLDVLPGMFYGTPGMFHRSFSHSIAAAFICAGIVAGIAHLWKKISFSKFFWLTLAAYFSHIFLDAFTGPIQLVLWPFSVTVKPIDLAHVLEHSHSMPHFENLEELGRLLISTSLAVRLGVETLLVYGISRVARFFPKYRVLGVSESPAFITGLALFIFMITAFLMIGQAGG